MKSAKVLTSVTNDQPQILTAIRAQMVAENPSFENRLPQVTQDNIREFGTAVLDYQPTQNAFVDTLVNLIGRVWITYRLFTNPMRVLKKGILEYGDTVELVYTNLAKAHQFDPAQAEEEWMKREIPDVTTAFAKLNYQVFYKKTITDDMLRQAFMSWQGLSDFISSVFNSMYSGAETDEFITMKDLLAQYGTAGKFAVEVIGEVTDNTSAHMALAKMKAVSNKMAFMRSDYNSLGVLTATPKEKQVLIIDADTDAYLAVLGYSTLFNLEPAKVQYRVIVVDEIPIQDTHAILIDEDFYAVWDALQKFTRDMNGQGLYWQYWAHYWRIMAVCPFANAVAFVTTAPTITGVTISPGTIGVNKGDTVHMKATVEGTGLYPQGVTWTISGNSDSATTITRDGVLTIGSTEAGPVTVTATSIYNTKMNDTATINVKNGADTITVNA